MVDEKIVEGKQVERWTKKPVTVEVLLWTGRNAEEVKKFCPAAWMDVIGQLIIPTLEGNHQASVGDYIIKGVKGEFYPCKPDIFAATYTRAASTPEPGLEACVLITALCARWQFPQKYEGETLEQQHDLLSRAEAFLEGMQNRAS